MWQEKKDERVSALTRNVRAIRYIRTKHSAKKNTLPEAPIIFQNQTHFSIFQGKKMSSSSSRTIYVGNLPGDTRLREVEDLFCKYGPIVDIDLKLPPRPPGYAFIEYEDSRDAEDAIYYRDGYNFDGYRLRVELAHGGRGNSSSADHHGSYGGSGSSRAAPKHSDYRVLVTGLPPSASWQDLKDHMRQAGDVLFSQVFRDRGGMTGIVDYAHYDDMKYAIKKLDDSEFRNAFSRSYVRVREYDSRRSYSRSRSRDSRRSYSRSPYMSRSPSRSRSYSGRSGSISPKRKYTRRSPSVSSSRSRTRSRSPVTSHRHRESRSPSRSIRSISRSRSASVRSDRSRSIDSRDRD